MKKLALMMEGLRVAMRSLTGHRLRTSLTMLGVAIGIFAITIIFTIVSSLTYNLNKNLSRLGNTMLYVYHRPWSEEGMRNFRKYYSRPRVDYAEYTRLKKGLRNVDGVALEARLRRQTVKYGTENVSNVAMRAVTRDYIMMNDFNFEKGRPFAEAEIDGGRPVCIIGHNVAESLFVSLEPIGKWVRIQGKKVKVVGVAEKSGTNMFGNSPDDMVVVPYGFAARIYRLNSNRVDTYISVQVNDPDRMPIVENDIIGLMRAERGLRPKAENDFAINRPEMLMQVFSGVTDYLYWGGFIISFFSLIVGGFGIGNIMFSTVKERTYEIGLQKALGATRGFILFQFLMEAVLLCLFGGILGLLMNYGVTQILQFFINQTDTGFELIISAGNILTGVLLSVLIGLVSGYIPSAIASRMDPVESMRA